MLNGSCTDNAGNVGNGSSAAFKFDSGSPTVTITTPLDSADLGTGWFNIASSGIDGVVVDVATSDGIGVISLTCTDNLVDVGPLDPAGDSFFIYDGTHAIECTATDAASNPDTDTDSFKVDQAAPTISVALDRAADITGWFNLGTGAPIAQFTCGDTGSSGLVSCPIDYTFGEGENQSHSGTAYDNAGNSASDTVSDVDVDLTAPTVSLAIVAGTLGNNGWHVSNVTVDVSGADVISGVLDANCSADQYQTTNTTPAGVDFYGSCTDNAGNVGNADSLTVKLDKTDPSVAITSPASGLITVAQTITVSGTASDTPSGIDTVAVNGGDAVVPGDGTFWKYVALSCGVNTISALATDLAGRPTTSNSITVTRVCIGSLTYYQSIDQSTTSTIVNTGKFGRVIPVKVTGTFNVGGAPIVMTEAALATYGLTLRIGVNGATCNSGAASDSVEAYADAGSANDNTNLFRWSTSQWIYNLDTGKAPSVVMVINQCYRLDVYLQDAGGAKALLSTGPGAGLNPYAIFKPTK